MRKLIFAGGILAALLMFLCVNSASAYTNFGSTTFNTDSMNDCNRYVATGTWSWQVNSNNSTYIYNFTNSGSYSIYNTCNGNILIDSGYLYGKGHQVLKDGQLATFHEQSNSTAGGDVVRFQFTSQNGQTVIEHIWINGVKIQ
jgi:hypothetical protein